MSITSAALSTRQREILEHALGWPKDYRNHFVTGPDTVDYDDCETLVKMGLMERDQRMLNGDLFVYSVTAEGRAEVGR
jgi:hypothetical protein